MTIETAFNAVNWDDTRGLHLTAERQEADCPPLYRFLRMLAFAGLTGNDLPEFRPIAWDCGDVLTALECCGRWFKVLPDDKRAVRALLSAIADELLTEAIERRLIGGAQ